MVSSNIKPQFREFRLSAILKARVSIYRSSDEISPISTQNIRCNLTQNPLKETKKLELTYLPISWAVASVENRSQTIMCAAQNPNTSIAASAKRKTNRNISYVTYVGKGHFIGTACR